MKGAKTPCMPSLVPVVQLVQPGKLFGRMVERSGALAPSRIKRASTGKRPAAASGRMRSNVAPSNPMITVFIYLKKDIGVQQVHYSFHQSSALCCKSTDEYS